MSVTEQINLWWIISIENESRKSFSFQLKSTSNSQKYGAWSIFRHSTAIAQRQKAIDLFNDFIHIYSDIDYGKLVTRIWLKLPGEFPAC